MSDVRLPVPVRKALDDSVDEAKLTRLWQGLVASRGRRVVPVNRAWIIGFASALVAALFVAMLVRSPSGAPLRLADGRDVPAMMARGGATRLSFDEGSIIDVAAGTGLDLLETTARSFAMAIRSGTIALDVTPGGPRSWRIECGPVTVEVVGTRFSVERTAVFVRVAVSRGAVLVRGDKVPDHVVRLGPGQAIVIPVGTPGVGSAEPSARVAAPEATSPIDENGVAPSSASVPRAGASPPSASVVRSPVAPSAAATPDAIPAASVARFAAPDAPKSPASTIDDGLATADALRRAGRFAEAASVLERALAEHGGDASAPLVEFSLGRLYLDSMGNAVLARAHFARAVGRGLPSAIAEDAEARFVEASVRAGDLPGARVAAARYHAHYPGGRHVSDVDGWLAGSP